MPEPLVLVERREGGVLRLTLNRPEVRNAFDDRVIRELTGRPEDSSKALIRARYEAQGHPHYASARRRPEAGASPRAA